MKDVVKTAKPAPRSGRPRRRRRNLSLYYLLLIFACVIIFLILSRTLLFNIRDYEVIGSNIYSSERILEAGNLRLGRNMYGINLEKTAEKIKNELIYVDNITLKRKLPDKMIVEVTEAQAVACCEYEGSRYAVITRSGRYLETEQLGARAGLILITGMELTNVALGEEFESLNTAKRDIILNLLESIHEICDGRITGIDITDRTNITLVYDDRITVDFGSSLDYEYKLRYISTIIENNLDQDAEGTLIYHSTAAGASFIEKEDMAINEQENAAGQQVQENAPANPLDEEPEDNMGEPD